MTAPTKEDFELHLRHLDDRLEATAKLFDERLDSHRKLFDERVSSERALLAQWREAQQKLLDERDVRFGTVLEEFRSEVAAARSESRSIRSEMAEYARSLKIFMVTTAIATVGSIATFNATVLSNMVASFDSGRTLAASLAETASELKQIQNDVTKTRQEVQELVESLRGHPRSNEP
ncbi:hypothetical protein C9I57_23005 [Trinickia symbiotica]|uniref:Uncharacterized protein n=1 Tax=Trinickia symbiotica TaxID=863227 RepID=A0A2T3XPL4_9BURK|nr:hypothetical protein [Trinickia symbiotica]PTB18466.1 hypothetical protein C9I57_23005 [Trinickia symbiotica]